jgi:hypothetical protein
VTRSSRDRFSRAVKSPRIAAALLAGRSRRSRPGIAITDATNRLRFGQDAPQVAQLIWVDPAACSSALNSTSALGPDPSSFSGHVVGGDWDLEVRPVEEVQKIAFGLRHWREGVPWAETGAYEHMTRLISERGRPVDRCETLADIIARYERLDEIYLEALREGRLKARAELSPSAFRERTGILVHISRNTTPIFGGSSHNRFAMALALDLPVIPAQLGAVHRQAVGSWRTAFTCSHRAR